MIITVTNQKGGVGKTTTAVNLAYSLAKDHKAEVLLIDFDPQGNATSGLGIDKLRLKSATNADGVPTILDAITNERLLAEVIQPTKFKRLSVAPATPQLADAESGLAKAERRFVRLRDAIKPVSGDYDFIIIDSPPSLSLLTVNALIAAGHVLLPVQAEFYALEGLSHLLKTIKLVQKGLNPSLEIQGVVLTMYDSRNRLTQHIEEDVREFLGDTVYRTVIPRNVRMSEAPSHGKPALVYDMHCRGSQAYLKLARELLQRENIVVSTLTAA